jgi:hypothetical protein
VRLFSRALKSSGPKAHSKSDGFCDVLKLRTPIHETCLLRGPSEELRPGRVILAWEVID